MMKLFPKIEPFDTFYHEVSGGHKLYVETSGSPEGAPVLYLHGGPGGGLNPNFRRLFDPNHFRIIMFDQRGAGRSRPHASLENNTLQDLIEDIESIRRRLGFREWLVTGGSWGSTLAVAYAQKYANRVTGLILRGMFLCRPSEIHWMYQHGACELFPDIWERYIEPISEGKRSNYVKAYYELLTSDNYELRMRAAKAWSSWEFALMNLVQDRDDFSEISDDVMLAMARIECHYFLNNIFLPDGESLLDDIQNIAHIPTTIIHGRYDVVCPLKTAWDVHKALPNSRLHIISDAGHGYNEPGIVDCFLRSTYHYLGDSLQKTTK